MKTILKALLSLALVSVSLQQSYSPALGLEFAKASSVTYCTANQLTNLGCGEYCTDLSNSGYTYIKQVQITTGLGENSVYSLFINNAQKKYVVSFRGATNTQAVNFALNQGATEYALNGITGAQACKFIYNSYKADFRDAFIRDLKEAVQQYSDYDFFIVGHSLGAAYATLAVLDARHNVSIAKEKLHMYNYGSPRVGNYAFAKAVEASVSELYRVVHYNDLATHNPFCQLESTLVGNCIPAPAANDPLGKLKAKTLFYAWHVSPEVYYNKENSVYKVCEQDEDPTCGDQFYYIQGGIQEHTTYYNLTIGCGDPVTQLLTDLAANLLPASTSK